MWNLKYHAKQKQTHKLREQTYDYQRGNLGRGGINREYEINTCTLLYVKQITNRTYCTA